MPEDIFGERSVGDVAASGRVLVAAPVFSLLLPRGMMSLAVALDDSFFRLAANAAGIGRMW